MSRIQNILDKADREGVIRRVRTVADGSPATAMAEDAATLDEVEPAFVTRRVAIPAEAPAAPRYRRPRRSASFRAPACIRASSRRPRAAASRPSSTARSGRASSTPITARRMWSS